MSYTLCKPANLITSNKQSAIRTSHYTVYRRYPIAQVLGDLPRYVEHLVTTLATTGSITLFLHGYIVMFTCWKSSWSKQLKLMTSRIVTTCTIDDCELCKPDPYLTIGYGGLCKQCQEILSVYMNDPFHISGYHYHNSSLSRSFSELPCDQSCDQSCDPSCNQYAPLRNVTVYLTTKVDVRCSFYHILKNTDTLIYNDAVYLHWLITLALGTTPLQSRCAGDCGLIQEVIRIIAIEALSGIDAKWLYDGKRYFCSSLQ